MKSKSAPFGKHGTKQSMCNKIVGGLTRPAGSRSSSGGIDFIKGKSQSDERISERGRATCEFTEVEAKPLS